MSKEIEALLAHFYHPGLKTIEPGLERVERFLRLLGAPHERLPPVIHVAGTNGKGSLIAYLQAIFEAAGYMVHRYTSPHLVRFNERIVLGGRPVSDDELKDLLERALLKVREQPVTYFEATTAAAFLAFAEHPADVLLLETGMGGRWDATNVIDRPILTAITPVSLDHCEFLGDSVAAIAAEKAGIIKSGVPCVAGRQGAEANEVIARTAEEKGAPLYRFGREWEVTGEGMYRSPERCIALRPSLVGDHQIDNAATAVACIDRLPGYCIGNAPIREGLARTVWPGRLQRLDQGRFARLLPPGFELWLDGGHNPQGGAALAGWLRRRNIPAYLVCGMVRGKDSAGYFKALAGTAAEVHAIAIRDEPLSQSAEEVRAAAEAAGLAAFTASSVENALQTVTHHARTPAIICICGSLYLAGKALSDNEG